MAESRYMEQGYRALNQRYFLTALSFFKRALFLNPANDEALAAIGTCYLLTKNYKNAARFFSEALQLNPSNTQAQENIAVAYDAMGKQPPMRNLEKKIKHPEEERVSRENMQHHKIEIVSRKKKGEDNRILACPFCSSLFFRDNIFAWLAEYGRCPTCNRLLLPNQLLKKDWNTYKNEKCSIDMIRFDMKR